MNEGLTGYELKQFSDLIIKANSKQLVGMMKSIDKQIDRRWL